MDLVCKLEWRNEIPRHETPDLKEHGEQFYLVSSCHLHEHESWMYQLPPWLADAFFLAQPYKHY